VEKQLWNCRQCKPNHIVGDVFGLVMWLDRCDYRTARAKLPSQTMRQVELTPAPKTAVDISEYTRRQHDKAKWLWSQRRPIAGTIADKYLRQTRGITCELPNTLGFLPARDGHPPAMVACYADDSGDRVDSVHLTRLLADGSDRERGDTAKITIGSPRGRPIVIAPVNDLCGLGIAEGVEDALSVYQATGLGAWAAGSAAFLSSLADAVPDYVEAVTIFAHPDQAGEAGARRLAEDLASRSIETRIEGIVR
jgi:hypothetical protein